MPVRFIVSEYNLLWEALRLYEQHLQRESTQAEGEDAQILADEKLIKLDAMLKDVQEGAQRDWGLDLR
ncbi:hypothetical protein [Roseateles chitosanitabidus]|jgi:hypothetical protein|uniref:hypothetical protein n=1 Tax=Roseateles chitosanitabidus TaxID=65048 RepID=UPI00082A845D|nr:hypothetical protein [Roseateles chitosanitabidus]